MSTATVMLRLRARPRLGPALRRTRVPVACVVLSTIFHAGLIALFVLAADFWQAQQSKTYVVNLVSAVAAVGRPEARSTQPTPTPLAPRVPEPAPAAPHTTPPPELPARSDATRAPELPARALPPRSLPPREPPLPRPSEKELPPIAGATAKTSPVPSSPAVAARTAMPQLGRPDGSPQGSGTVTLNVTDFKYAWYARQVERKIRDQWNGRAIDGRQPAVVFEIGRDGRLHDVRVDKTSGNSAYDQLAVRAIRSAEPFPPLPDDFDRPVMRFGLQFVYDPNAT